MPRSPADLRAHRRAGAVTLPAIRVRSEPSVVLRADRYAAHAARQCQCRGEGERSHRVASVRGTSGMPRSSLERMSALTSTSGALGCSQADAPRCRPGRRRPRRSRVGGGGGQRSRGPRASEGRASRLPSAGGPSNRTPEPGIVSVQLRPRLDDSAEPGAGPAGREPAARTGPANQLSWRRSTAARAARKSCRPSPRRHWPCRSLPETAQTVPCRA